MKNVISLLLLLLVLGIPAYGQDSSSFLLPLGLYRTPGGFGSLWQTELTVRSTSSVPIQLYHAGILCIITCPYPSIDVAPGAAVRYVNTDRGGLVASRSGLVLHAISRDPFDPADIHFGFRVRDLSRDTLAWGTEIPVIRASQFSERPIQLLNVPTSTAFRVTVRIYALEGATPIPATIQVRDAVTGAELRSYGVLLGRAEDHPGLGPTGDFYYPAYAQFDSIATSFAAAGDAVNLEILSPVQGQKLWAFVSITNNETQQVTTVTPQ